MAKSPPPPSCPLSLFGCLVLAAISLFFIITLLFLCYLCYLVYSPQRPILSLFARKCSGSFFSMQNPYTRKKHIFLQKIMTTSNFYPLCPWSESISGHGLDCIHITLFNKHFYIWCTRGENDFFIRRCWLTVSMLIIVLFNTCQQVVDMYRGNFLISDYDIKMFCHR